MMGRMISSLTFLIIMFAATCSVSASLVDGLVAYYPFNVNADDASGNGNHGVVVTTEGNPGATLTSNKGGKFGEAYKFDGNDIILVNSTLQNFGLLEPSTALTLSAWIKNFDPVGNWQRDNIISKDSKIGSFVSNNPLNEPSTGYLLRTSPPANDLEGNPTLGNEILFYAGGYKPDAPHIRTTDWLHVVGTYLGGNIISEEKLYINGVISSVRTYSTENPDPLEYVPSSIPYTGGNLGIGGPFDNIGGNYFNGLIDDVRIYNRALTESEVYDLYTIPEPATVVLLGIGLTGLAGTTVIRRIKRKA